MIPSSILPLADARATLDLVGGKGASLARLATAGLPVPSGFHVTTDAYRRFVADNGLQPVILDAVRTADPVRPDTLEAASRVIHDRFLEASMPDAVAEEIAAAYAQLPGEDPAVAVRSSATAEDLPELSFAGQQETLLNVHGRPALLNAVKRCWASLWTARALGYRAQHGIDQEAVSLAVVVQLLVPADAAGVLFTADPVTGARDQLMMTAAWGLGEAIVGGQVTPDTLTVEKATGRIVSQEIADKQVMTVRTAAGTEERSTPDALRRAPVLDRASVAELTRLGVQIERLYGVPMDVEWALTAGGSSGGDGESGLGTTEPRSAERRASSVAILQARPITGLPPEPEAPLAWRLPDPDGKYARSSIIELLPGPLSPLFGSLGVQEINQGYRRLAETFFGSAAAIPKDLMVTINDFAYYDIRFGARQTLAIVVQMPRFVRKAFGTAETRWRYESRPRYAETVARWQQRELSTLPARELLRGVHEILVQAIDHYSSIQAGILPSAYLSEYLFTLFYEHVVRRPDDPPAVTFVLGFDSLPIRAEKSLYDLAHWCRERPALADLLAQTPAAQIATWLAEPTSSHAAPLPATSRPEEWPELQARFASHLARFGHAIYDLDFAQPVPADDPTPLLETLRQLVQGHGSDPYRRQRAAAGLRVEAVGRMRARLRGWRRSSFRRLLDWTQRYAPLREDALGDVGLGWPLVRRLLRELGRRLVVAGAVEREDDVFWLLDSEVDAFADELDRGRTRLDDTMAAVRERKARIGRESRQTPPSSLPERVTFAGFDFTSWLPARTTQEAGDTIRGIGASPGRVTAIARVLRGPEQFGQLRQGDVLVAPITTPAWTPLFALAAGVVTDVGGPLSHSSIVAREYGIPAVLGTGVATQRIQSGETIVVDGSAGTVTLVARRPPL
ncbi:MAG: PEP/pyruvate-binding domain-containing protein [Chloroflexota bacterium]